MEGWTGQQAASSTTASESSSIKSNFLFLQPADSFSLCFMFVVHPVYIRGQCSRDTPHLKMGDIFTEILFDVTSDGGCSILELCSPMIILSSAL